MTEQPTALRLAEYWENCAKYLQTWVDENEYVEFCYHPERLKKEQADQQCTATELRRLHEELQEQCRINGMGAEREARLMAVNQELVKVLKQIIDSPDEDSDIEAYENALSVLRKATGEQP